MRKWELLLGLCVVLTRQTNVCLRHSVLQTKCLSKVSMISCGENWFSVIASILMSPLSQKVVHPTRVGVGGSLLFSAILLLVFFSLMVKVLYLQIFQCQSYTLCSNTLQSKSSCFQLDKIMLQTYNLTMANYTENTHSSATYHAEKVRMSSFETMHTGWSE